ncbi:prepilin peptidase [Anaerovorax odorimutans]|uniref:prepilin peptidase n=1 Tax=Anaerovorax odorimutans TaxID=109327 RepID=UPI00041B2E9C|nr:prepilin peptidase [Anaerovorax odorimutans]
MNIYITMILGALGILIGLFLPFICDQIILYKNKKISLHFKTYVFNKKIYILFLILNGLLWIYSSAKFEYTFIALLVSLIFTTAIIITIIDLRIRIIPNELVILMFFLSLPFQIFYFGWMSLLYAFICMIIVGFIFTLVGKFVGLNQVGAGDIKLASVMGFLLGYPYIMIALIGISVSLVLFCLIGLAFKKRKRQIK